MDAVSIVERARGAAIATDEVGRILALSEPAGKLLGHESQEVRGQSLLDLLEVRDVFGNRLGTEHIAFWEMVSQSEAIESLEYNVRSAAGVYMRVGVSIIVVLGPRPDSYQLVYFLCPIRRRRKADEVIERILANPQGLKPHLRSLEGTSETPRLTPRQIEVLRHLSRGRHAEKIAAELGVSVHTVRSHIQTILGKLGARSQVEAVARAFRDRLF